MAQNLSTCCMRQSSSFLTNYTKRTKFTFRWRSRQSMPPTGPMSVQPRGVRMACGSPLLPRLSSNTQKGSGALVPTINRTSFSLILGNFVFKVRPLSEGIFRREAFSLSTVHSLLTSTLSVARVLSHKEISEPLSRSAYVSTALFASRLQTFTGTTLRQTFPPPTEVLLVCPLGNGMPLLTWVGSVFN